MLIDGQSLAASYSSHARRTVEPMYDVICLSFPFSPTHRFVGYSKLLFTVYSMTENAEPEGELVASYGGNVGNTP